MILLTKSAEHDFLNEEWCDRLVAEGVKMTDASYYLVKICGETWIISEEEYEEYREYQPKPTYTLSDMIYKFNEYAYSIKDGTTYLWGGVNFVKDAPFYIWAYYPNREKFDQKDKYPLGEFEGKNFMEAIADTPIIAAARFLINCKKLNIPIVHGADDKRKEL